MKYQKTEKRKSYGVSGYAIAALHAIIIVLFTSCEKVIDFELKDTAPVMVIESVANAQNGTITAKLSYSGDYYSASDFQPVTGATVKTDINGSAETILNEISPGEFQAQTPEAGVGDIFNFVVKIDGAEYSASSEVHRSVGVDSVFFIYSAETVFAPEGYRAMVVFRDPQGKGDFYRIQMYVNGAPATEGMIYLYNDNTTDGEPVSYNLYRNSLNVGDRIRVEIWTFDKQVYDYYSGLEKLISDYPASMQISPANPASNISGGVLGYFAAVNVSSSQEVVTQ